MPVSPERCLRCWTTLHLERAPKVVCPECGCTQPHLSTDVGEFFDCLTCGEPLAAPTHDGTNELRCPRCGANRTFVRGPMVIVTGGPGVGKSTLGIELAPRLPAAVVLEPPAGMITKHDSLTIMTWFKDWLVLAAQVAQGGRYAVIPSFARPDELDARPERAWVGRVHWLALVCDPEVLTTRLRGRRKSRAITDQELDGLLGVNEEIRAIASTDPRATLLDTSLLSRGEVVETAARLISSWVG